MRLFVALMLEQGLAKRLAAEVAASLGPALEELRPVRSDSLHLTLHFLGETAPERRLALEEALGPRLTGAPAPELRLTRTGAFPDRGARRVLWVGPDERPGAEGRLAELHRRVLDGVAAAGIALPDPPEPYRPHLTVARSRSRQGMRPPAAFRELELALDWRPAEAALVESAQPGSAVQYPVLRAWALAPGLIDRGPRERGPGNLG